MHFLYTDMLQAMTAWKWHCQHTSVLLEYLRPFVNSPLAHTVAAILDCQSSVNCMSFHALIPQNSEHKHLK